jgi:amylosucrase
MLATGNTVLARHALAGLPTPPTTGTWITYVRCHDDIGWAIDDGDAAACGVTGAGHRAFLAEFYRGDFPGSFARGTPFGVNTEIGDERTSGMTATLAGVTAALADGDDEALDRAIARILLLYRVAFGFGGIPIVYMGDELCQQDDTAWHSDPARRHDTRWTHRPSFDHDLATSRHDLTTPTGRVWAGLRHLIEIRRVCPQLDDTAATSRPFDTSVPGLFGWHRHSPRHGDLVGLANVGDGPEICYHHPAMPASAVDLLSPDDLDPWFLAPLQVRWIAEPGGLTTVPAPPGAV